RRCWRRCRLSAAPPTKTSCRVRNIASRSQKRSIKELRATTTKPGAPKWPAQRTKPIFLALLNRPPVSYNGNALLLAKRKTVLGAGLLCIALTLVVLFTSPAAFRSSAAVIVMALIGAAAVLLQLQVRAAGEPHSRSPLWLNLMGIVLTVAALFPAALHVAPRLLQALVLGAVGSFAISSAMILHSFRKRSAKPE